MSRYVVMPISCVRGTYHDTKISRENTKPELGAADGLAQIEDVPE